MALGLVAVLLAGTSGCDRRPEETDAAAPAYVTRDFTFVSQGLTLSGVISQPAREEAKALIVFVHGYGPTNVRGWDMYADLRSRFADLGIASVTWDKPGQGRSAGTFDINQPVESSAQEVQDAIAWLRANQVPGANRIGLWGLSRAGWIAPLALAQDPEIKFWISVSGTTAEDNYFYLLQSNLPHEGATPEEAEIIMHEWKRGYEIFRTGGTHAEFCAATTRLRTNAYIARMTGDVYSQEFYEREQAQFQGTTGPPPVDLETGMPIHIQNFDALLANLNLPVLALFGEKDLNVDWRKTRALYESTFGRNPHASLTVRTFPDANHNIDVCATGSLREMETMRDQDRRKSAGYYEVQVEWLKAHALK